MYGFRRDAQFPRPLFSGARISRIFAQCGADALLATPAASRGLNAATLPLIGYAGGLASVVLPFLWLRGVQILGPGRCAIFMNLLPILTAAGVIVVLGGPVRAWHVIGGAMALAGVACTRLFQFPLRVCSRA